MIIKDKKELEALRDGGKILAGILNEVATFAMTGKSARELDRLTEELIKKNGGNPSFKGYRSGDAKASYPASLCVSVNEEVVHGIPTGKKLKNGDVVGLDIGMIYKELHTDAARTIIVGGEEIFADEENQTANLNAFRLIEATQKALDVGISEVRAGIPVGTIGFAIQRYLEDRGYGVIRELVGHGVGRAVHEDPEIPNWGARGKGYKLHEGEVIALEPMATIGSPKVKLLTDGWTWVTADKSIAAHFEHTLVVTKNGAEVLTKENN